MLKPSAKDLSVISDVSDIERGEFLVSCSSFQEENDVNHCVLFKPFTPDSAKSKTDKFS